MKLNKGCGEANAPQPFLVKTFGGTILHSRCQKGIRFQFEVRVSKSGEVISRKGAKAQRRRHQESFQDR
jgi:hypothetical protein